MNQYVPSEKMSYPLYTEDEFNNLLIEMYLIEKEWKDKTISNINRSYFKVAGETISVTISSKDHYTSGKINLHE